MPIGQNNPTQVNEEVIVPKESYGVCSRKDCGRVGYLGDGLCGDCWDRGVKGYPAYITPIKKLNKNGKRNVI